MKPGLLDMTEQWRHVLDVMLAILQPALWLLLCVGFVLASAHLLTMFGTRWGDRRVSPKALFFSIAIHLSLGVAVVAMIPEYRQHILSLGQEDPPPVSVDLVSPTELDDLPPTSQGDTPVWDRIPQQAAMPQERSEAVDVPPEPLPQPDRPSTIQLASVRPVERPTIPAAPEVLPVPQSAAAPQLRQSPAEAVLPVEVAAPEARPEAPLPERTPDRTKPVPVPETPADVAGSPPSLNAVDQRPMARPIESPLASLAPTRSELPVLDRSNPPPARMQPVPVTDPLPVIQPNPPTQPAMAATGSRGAEPQGPQRTRTAIASRSSDDEAPNAMTRPGLLPSTTDAPPREPERTPLPRRDDPTLPDLFRPQADPAKALASVGPGRVPASYSLRTDQDRKDEAIRKYGGNADTQKAVELALRWLAGTQERDGRWDADKYGAGSGPRESDVRIANRQYAGQKSDTGVSALVLLAFLGNGNSMSDGPYSVNVERAVSWLIATQGADGSLAGDATVFEAMYCHGIATLALAEAFAMETDPLTRSTIKRPLERALQYTAAHQLEDGGWRYIARQEGGGDMSMFGWQLMSYRSAQDGGLPIPENVRSQMIRFLTTRARGKDGGLAAYWKPDDPISPAMTAEALFCKQMLGLKRDNPMALEATAYLLTNRPKLSEMNLYYWYYGTLAMFQHGGDEWQQWNEPLRELLLSQQVTAGSFAGTWEPRDLYSRYGGRLFSTAIATLCLEVYYRRLPMYQRAEPAGE